MIRRFLRRAVVLAIIAGAVGGAIVVARKLMGGLGPQPGSSGAPLERPSLVPDPPGTPAADADPSGNGDAAPSQTAQL